jgi:hypothetical protein
MIEIKWQNRFDSLAPVALVAFGTAAVRLKEKLLSFDDEKLNSLQGVFGKDLLFAAGEGENLPWMDGLIYLGKDAQAPSILLPTNLRPALPIDLFERRLLQRFPRQKPFAVVGNRIIPVGEMRPISRKVLSEVL